MNSFMSQMRNGPRIIAVTGHFGSGKTEFCVSLAFALRALSDETLAIADLDIENPFFRSRERQNELEKAGIEVYSDPFHGRNGSELQTISSTIRTPLENENCRVILDTGGDYTGARILNQFKKYFAGEYQLLCVINPFRPGSDTIEKAVEHIRSIEAATGLHVTGLIANGHLIRQTTTETVQYGWRFTVSVAEAAGIRPLAACCMNSLVPEMEQSDYELFPIGMYMRDSYLDKQV